MKKETKIPRWLELQAEIDYWHYCLNQMLEQTKKNTSPIAIMIDKATGFSKAKTKEAKEIIKHVKKLKKEYYKILK